MRPNCVLTEKWINWPKDLKLSEERIPALLLCTKSKMFKAVTIVCLVHIHMEFVSCYSH